MGRTVLTHLESADRQAIDRTLTTRLSVLGEGPQAAITRVRHLNLQQLAALEVRGHPSTMRNALSTPHAVFVYALLEGQCTISWESGRVQVSAGQLLVASGDRTLDEHHELPFLFRGTRMPAAQLERELPQWRQAELKPVDALSGPGALLIDLQDRLLARGDVLGDRSADAYTQAMACVLAEALSAQLPGAHPSPHSQADHHRRRIRAYVREHLGDPQLSIAAVARSVGLSTAHLHRLFAHEPLSLAAWIQAERLDACRDSLASPDAQARSVTEVAMSWGFADAAHFSRCFKRRFGLAPSLFRERAGERQAQGLLQQAEQQRP